MFELWTPTQANSAAQVQPAGVWRYALLVLLTCVVLIAREPHKILNAQFIAEDGTVFFAQEFNTGLGEAFLTRYAGYYHVIPRLFAAVGMMLPYRFIPLFYSLTALLVTALALTWFYLPQHRHLVQSDSLRLATVLLFLCAPNLAALMQIAYVQWSLAVWALLVTLTPLPTKSWAAWSAVLIYLLVIGTAPVVIVWLPIWLLRLYGSYSQKLGTATPPAPSLAVAFQARSPAKGGSYWLGRRRIFFCPFTVPSLVWRGVGRGWQRAHLICLILAHGLIVFTGLTAPATLPKSTQNLTLLLLDFGRGFVYQVGVINLLGREVSEWLLAQLGWWALYAIGLGLVAAVLSLLIWQKNRQKRFVSWVLLYVIVASSMLYLNRAGLFGFIFANNLGNMHRGAARYFWVASVALYLFTAIQVGTWLAYSVALRPVLVSSAGYLLLLGLYSLAFRIPVWGNMVWAPHARLLEHLQATQHHAQPCPPLIRSASQPVGEGEPFLAKGEHTLFLPLVLKPQFLPTANFLVNLAIAPSGWVMHLTVSNVYVQRFPEGLVLLGVEEQIVDQAFRIRLFWQGDLGAVATAGPRYRISVHLIDQQGSQVASDEAAFDQPRSASQEVAEVFQSQHTLAFSSDLAPNGYNLAVSIRPQQDQNLHVEELLLVENCIKFRPEFQGGSQWNSPINPK